MKKRGKKPPACSGRPERRNKMWKKIKESLIIDPKRDSDFFYERHPNLPLGISLAALLSSSIPLILLMIIRG